MHVVSRVLLRAPLLPERELDDAARALARHAFGEMALRLASPALQAHADDRSARAHHRYARRAAFRATPHGLFAGVAVAVLGERTSIALGEPKAVFAPRFDRVASLARALLETEQGWRAAKIRHAPSLLRVGDRARWLRFGSESGAEAREVELDAVLDRVLALTARWTPAVTLAKRMRDVAGDGARAFVLELVDDGLLHHDLEPALVGSAPSAQARRRLAPLCPALTHALDQLDGLTTVAQLGEAERRWAELPGATDRPSLHALLLHQSDALRVERAPIERAAQLAPVLFALGEALHPPIAEAAIQPGLADALEAAGALVGEGLLALPELELGAYGARLRDDDDSASPRPSSVALAYLAGKVVEAAREGREEMVLQADELAASLPRVDVPSSYELQLTPARDTAWLLGVHAPAGATWGRFAHALGDALGPALLELRGAETSLDGDALRVDVSYAPTTALADLCCVPPLRDAALAISSWPEDAAVIAADCAMANQPASAAHGGLAVGGRPLRASPLHRVRSSTAPPSVWRALLGDTLHRQHAPWALGWGALSSLPWLPRATLDGFVIAPQSWALPEPLTPEALDAWRRAHASLRHVQVGAEDALLPIDLDDADDRATLCSLPREERLRAFEIWPPLGHTLDDGGRRVELVAAVVHGGEEARTAAIGAMDLVPPPRAARGWRTVKVFAPRERHADLLVEQIAPLVDRRDLRGWFFLPYVDPPAREHLRVRLRARDDVSVARMATIFADALAADPRVSTVEIGAYHPEHARWGAALSAVERVFESDARLVLDLASDDLGLPQELLLAAGLDALALGLGLDARTREGLAAQAFAAYGVSLDEERDVLAPGYRALQRSLLALLDDPPVPFAAHQKRARAARLSRGDARRLLPTLAHLAAVRLCGTDRDAEVRGLYLWKRALESRRARRRGRRSS